MQITLATPEDKQEILDLYHMQIGREFCPWDMHYPGKEEIDKDLSYESLFVMRNDLGQIIGSISIDHDEEVDKLPCWSPNGMELARLAIHPDYQNRGLARELIKHCMSVLKNAGMTYVHFLVNKHNIKALKSYEKLEFDLVGETELFNQPFYCYEKLL